MSKAKLRKVKETIRDEEGFPMRIDGLQKLQSEIQLMRHLFHRNVSILFEVSRRTSDPVPLLTETSLQVMDDPQEDSVILVTEYMAGGAVMNFNSATQRYEFSPSAAAILQRAGKVINGEPLSPTQESSVRPMTEAEAISLFCDLLKVPSPSSPLSLPPSSDSDRVSSTFTPEASLIVTSSLRTFCCITRALCGSLTLEALSPLT
jgi:hypothetical protein